MAGKKKTFQDDVKLSKTARSSKGKKKDEGFQASADMDRIISLNNSKWCYIMDPRDGKTHHLYVGSTPYITLIDALIADPKHGPRIQVQLAKLGWSN